MTTTTSFTFHNSSPSHPNTTLHSRYMPKTIESIKMPNYQEWHASQFKEQENLQPFRNETTLYQYIPRKNGDPPIPTTHPSAPTATTTAGVSCVPVGSYYSYPATLTWPVYPVFPSPSVRTIKSSNSPATTPQYPTAPYPTYPHPAYCTPPPPQPVVYPTTGYYPYGYYYFPATTAAAATATAKPEPSTLPNGAIPWCGRTRAEVEYDNNLLAAAGSANTAAVIKPDAKPDQVFWVWEPDKLTRNLYTFAAIDKNFKGEWKMDPTTGHCYFVRS